MIQRYRLHADLRLAALEDEGVLLHLTERRYFSVNETGLAMLEAMRAPQSLADLVRVLTDAFEVTEDEAREAAEAFLERCLNASVVVREPEDG